jgi:hypothetical protein
LTIQPVRVPGQPPPIVICQAQALSAGLAPKQAVLFDQIRKRLPLPAIQPTGQGSQQQLQGRHVDHGGIYITDGDFFSRGPSMQSWDRTAS